MRDPSLGVREPQLVACGGNVHTRNEYIFHRKHLARNPGGERERPNCRVVRTCIYLSMKGEGKKARDVLAICRPTLCASMGSNLMHERDDREVAGQCACKRQYFPASL